AATRHHEALLVARNDERSLRPYFYLGVARGEDFAVRPMGSGFVAVQQAGFRQQHGPGAGGGERSAPAVAALQPGEFGGEAAGGRTTGRAGWPLRGRIPRQVRRTARE